MAKLAGDHVQVLVSGYELTGDSNNVRINDARDLHDVTAFGDAVHKFIAGQRNISIEHNGYLNPDTAGSHPVLNTAELEGIVSVLMGQNTAPAVGDPMYSLLTLQSKYQSLEEYGKVIPFAAAFANRGNVGGWGVALAVPTTFTDSSNGSSVDNGGATSSGGAAYLHVLQAAASDTYTFTVEGSTTGAFGGEESTLGTFTLDASALGSERLALAGSIPRYTRLKSAPPVTAIRLAAAISCASSKCRYWRRPTTHTPSNTPTMPCHGCSKPIMTVARQFTPMPSMWRAI